MSIKANSTPRYRKNHFELEESTGGLNTERNQINTTGNVFLRIETHPADGNDGDKGPGEVIFTDVSNPDGGDNRTLDEPSEINIVVGSRMRFGRLESPDRVRNKSPT